MLRASEASLIERMIRAGAVPDIPDIETGLSSGKWREFKKDRICIGYFTPTRYHAGSLANLLTPVARGICLELGSFFSNRVYVVLSTE